MQPEVLKITLGDSLLAFNAEKEWTAANNMQNSVYIKISRVCSTNY